MPPRGYKIRANRFRREMKRHGIANINQLANKMHMHRSTVGEVFAGKALAGVAFAENACRVFGLEKDDLFTSADPVNARRAA